MNDKCVAYCNVRLSVENPCTGAYTNLGPEAALTAELGTPRMKPMRLDGVALRRGTYRVTFERVED